MFHRIRKICLVLTLSLLPLVLHAETLNGVVRDLIKEQSRSFGLDTAKQGKVRVYVNSGTKFENWDGGKTKLDEMKEGDTVEVDAASTGPGVYLARQVKVQGNLEPINELKANNVSILPGQSFILGVGQSAVLRDEGEVRFKLRAVEFINEYCKAGYDCGGEGEIGMRCKVSQDEKGKGETEIRLTAKGGRKPLSPVKVSVFGYEVQLIEVGEDVVMLVVRKSS